FFFQAEDGIRDKLVTGVQTCALPICFSIGLINASGSLGLLFPPSLPIILYGVYSKTPISTLFVGGLLPGLLMVGMVCAWGVFQEIGRASCRERVVGVVMVDDLMIKVS